MVDDKKKKYLGKAGLTKWQMRKKYLAAFFLSLALVYFALVLRGSLYRYYLFLGGAGVIVSVYGFFKPNKKHFEPGEDETPPEM